MQDWTRQARGGSIGAGSAAARRGGFTFLELILVIAILAILFLISGISFRGLMPKYYLRTSARALATTLEHLRLTAVTRGVWMGIHYDLSPPAEERTYYEIIPPAPKEDPEQPIEQRQRIGKERTSPGVRIARIILANSQVIDRGTVSVLFSPMGNAGSHIVVLEGEEGRLASVKLNSITGTVEVVENVEASFQHYQD